MTRPQTALHIATVLVVAVAFLGCKPKLGWRPVAGPDVAARVDERDGSAGWFIVETVEKKWDGVYFCFAEVQEARTDDGVVDRKLRAVVCRRAKLER